MQIGPLGIENRILTQRNVHPFKQMMTEKQDRQEKDGQDRKQKADVFKLPSNNNRPFRVRRVMHDDPKETAGTKSEEIRKRDHPREGKLLWIDDSADATTDQGGNSDHTQQERQSGKPGRLKIFAVGRGNDLGPLAHFFSRSAACSGGTSADVAF